MQVLGLPDRVRYVLLMLVSAVVHSIETYQYQTLSKVVDLIVGT